MSELKVLNSERIYWAAEQVERVAGDIDELHLDDNLFYLKSEADKVIAELKNEIEEQKRLRDMALASVPNVLKVMKIIQRHKYKRCLAMAQVLEHVCPITTRKAKWRDKWRKRWLAIAEKFKPNSTAQQGKG